MMVPRVDADGNELGGCADPPSAMRRWAPISAGTSRRARAAPAYDGRPFHAGQVCNYVGGMVPFFKTKAQRLAAGDPRLSLEERYGTHAGYVAAGNGGRKQRVQTRATCWRRIATPLVAQAVASDVCNQPGDGGKCNPGP